MTDCWRRVLPQASVRGSCRGYRYLSCPQCRHRLAATPTIAEQTDFEEAARAPPFRFCLVRCPDQREKSNLRWRCRDEEDAYCADRLRFPRWQWRCQPDYGDSTVTVMPPKPIAQGKFRGQSKFR